MEPVIVGIDNGVSGALVAVRGREIIAQLPMPIQKARKGNEVDVVAIDRWFKSALWDLRGVVSFVIEEPGGSKSAKAACSMAGSFHAVRAYLESGHMRWHRITPQAWQKTMLPGCKPGDTKPRALARARQLWPERIWTATDRSTKPHDGLIDAALIAEYGRTQKL